MSIANAEAVQAWNTVLYDKFLRFRDTLTTGFSVHGARRPRALPAPTWEPGPGRRVRLRRRHARHREASGRSRRGDRRRRCLPVHRGGEERRCGGRRPERSLRGRGRPDRRSPRTLRSGLLALRHDVLREPGRRAAQPSPLAEAGRRPHDGGLEKEGRKSVPRSRREVRPRARSQGRQGGPGHLWSRPVLDVEPRCRERAAPRSRLRAIELRALRRRHPGRDDRRRRPGPRHGARPCGHDWDDATCKQILRVVRAAMEPGKRLIVCEIIVDRLSREAQGTRVDLQMMVACDQGRERSVEEIRSLLSQCGFRFTRAFPYPIVSVLEAEAV